MHGFDRNEQGKMFVGGLSWDTTKDSLLGYFSQYGEVIDCVVMKNPDTGKSRGFGFVTYRDPHCVETVLSSQVHIVDGRQVDPKACNPKGPNRGGGGREGGGGRGGMVPGGPMEGFGDEPPPRMHRGGPQGDIKDRKIFVGGLPNNADEESIKNFFSKYGNVQDVTIMYDPQKQRSRGFGFLTFENEDAVNKVCREHYVTFNGKKVECKMATPRDRRANNEGPPPGPPPMGHMGPQDEPQPLLGPPHPPHLPQLEMGGQPPQGPPFQVQEPNWGPPPEPSWKQQQPPQGPPPQLGAPPQFAPNVQFQGYHQGDQPPPLQPQGWPQPPPPASAGGWPPPGTLPPPNQPQTAVSAPFMSPPSATQTFSSAPGYQQAPSTIYQWATSPPGQQPPPNPNGQPPPSSALGQPPPQSGYSYSTAAYGSHPVTSPPNPGLPARSYQDFTNPALTTRSYQDFSNGQAQLVTSVAPVQPPPGPPPASTSQTFTSYTSPYAASAYAAPAYAAQAPQQVASSPPTDPYGQQTGVPAPPPQSAIQAPSTPGQPTTLQGYGSAIGQTPLATSADPAAASKATVDYSSYYSAYGYGAEATPNAAAAAYGAQPAPVPAPAGYGGQGEAQQAVAYGAPGPSPPTFQRHGSATQGYHPYARR